MNQHYHRHTLYRSAMALAAAIVATGSIAPATTNAQTDDASMSQFIKIRWPGRVTLAPDGTVYFVHNPDGIRQLYKVPPGKSQRDAVKLTTFEGLGAIGRGEAIACQAVCLIEDAS